MAPGDDVHLRELADFVALVDENADARDSLRDKTVSMGSNGWRVIGLAGAGSPWIDDLGTGTDEVSSYSDSYDTSRLQLYAPTRDADGNSIMGGIAGFRSALGIDAPAFSKKLRTANALQLNLSQSQIEALINNNVNPIEEGRGAAEVVEDLTTVTDSNSTESSWTTGFARLVTDFTVEEIQETADPFFGEFNNNGVQNLIEGRVASVLKQLLESRAIDAFSLVLEEVDDVTLAVDVGIDTGDGLRNIELTVTTGDVQNGVTVEG
jgi:hypothetical protein